VGFEAIKGAFWNPRIRVEVQPPLTDEMVARAEQTLGVKLPDAYLTLLRIQNGGYTTNALRAFPTSKPTSWAADHVPFDSMYGIGESDEGILRSPYFLREWQMPNGLVLLTGDGHWWIALDYRTSGPSGPPSVVWYDDEVGEDIQLAPDFATFVEGLSRATTFDKDPS